MTPLTPTTVIEMFHQMLRKMLHQVVLPIKSSHDALRVTSPTGHEACYFEDRYQVWLRSWDLPSRRIR